MPQVTKRFGTGKTQTGICQFCGGKATLLCDMPKETEVVTMKALYTNTCDNEMCEACSIRFHGNDLCIGCIREIRTIWNNRVNWLKENT